jgi:hypothetical protein
MRTTPFHHVVFSTVKIRHPSLRMAPSGSLHRAFSASTDCPTFLPRLPVPELQKTLSKYLQSLIPLLQEDEARGGPSWRSALQERQQWADELERGLGAICQERLYGGSVEYPCRFIGVADACTKRSTKPLRVTGWTIIYGRRRLTMSGAHRY